MTKTTIDLDVQLPETSNREAFDVVTGPTDYRPITNLGFLTFHVQPFRGGIAYVEGFQARTLRMWIIGPRAERQARQLAAFEAA